MNRRRVMRRRIVVAVLLLLSVAMLTLYFRDSGSGVARGAQSGVMRVIGPLQMGTARIAKPFRDAWGWVTDLFHAKAENAELRKEVETLRAGIANKLATEAQNEELKGMLGFKKGNIYPKGAELCAARVIARSTTAWYSTVTIDAGSKDGVELYDAVVNGSGLVGRVTEVEATVSQVALITDQSSFVSAMILPGGAQGLVSGSVTGDVTMQYVDKGERIKVGQYIVTSGIRGSVFVRGVPIGVVESVGSQDVELYQTISVRPFVNVRKLDLVQVVVQ